MPPIELAKTLDDVHQMMARCTETAREENSADGYFTLIYNWETADLVRAADDGMFQAPDEIRKMIVSFANRYFTARAAFRAGEPTSRAWTIAFRAARTSSALVVQHILLAMNAHINFDLGPVTAQAGLPWSDFEKIGVVLCDGVSRIQGCLNRTTPVLRALDRVGGSFDEMFTIYSLKAARRYAFDLAQRMRSTPEAGRPALEKEADATAGTFGDLLLRPPLRDRLLLAAIRLSQVNQSPREILSLLDHP
jgi:Family of unknown function (DUF5995)